MQAPFLGYGLGTQSIDAEGYQLFGHKGNVIHHTITYYSPDMEVSLSVAINHSHHGAIDGTFYNLFSEIVDYLNPPTSLPGNLSRSNELSIYPNPVRSMVSIRFPNPDNASYQYTIRDLTGKDTGLGGITSASRFELNLGDLPAGLYFIELRGDKTFTGRMVIR